MSVATKTVSIAGLLPVIPVLPGATPEAVAVLVMDPFTDVVAEVLTTRIISSGASWFLW